MKTAMWKQGAVVAINDGDLDEMAFDSISEIEEFLEGYKAAVEWLKPVQKAEPAVDKPPQAGNTDGELHWIWVDTSPLQCWRLARVKNGDDYKVVNDPSGRGSILQWRRMNVEVYLEDGNGPKPTDPPCRGPIKGKPSKDGKWWLWIDSAFSEFRKWRLVAVTGDNYRQINSSSSSSYGTVSEWAEQDKALYWIPYKEGQEAPTKSPV